MKSDDWKFGRGWPDRLPAHMTNFGHSGLRKPIKLKGMAKVAAGRPDRKIRPNDWQLYLHVTANKDVDVSEVAKDVFKLWYEVFHYIESDFHRYYMSPSIDQKSAFGGFFFEFDPEDHLEGVEKFMWDFVAKVANKLIDYGYQITT